jgi:hypothetical protein
MEQTVGYLLSSQHEILALAREQQNLRTWFASHQPRDCRGEANFYGLKSTAVIAGRYLLLQSRSFVSSGTR